MKRFAFIDVQNTETTALKVLNFIFDWQKLIDYLETRWDCEKIFLYPGIQKNDENRKEIFTSLKGSTSEVVVRIKEYRVYKNQDKINSIVCPHCKKDVVNKADMGYSWKCNCDVEMTLDVLKNSEKDTEVLLFTGDGDFAFLVEEIIQRETKVRIFSSALSVGNSGYKRLSKKLKKLTNQTGSPVQLVELQNIQKIVQKVV